MPNIAHIPDNTHTTMEISVQHVGREQNPVIVIDNFYTKPEQLIALAHTEPSFVNQVSDFYPGVRKLIESDYADVCLRTIEPILRNTFKINSNHRAQQKLCAFSLATTPIQNLRPIQCVPHIDTHDENQFALVHYLCSKPFGGTSFYRHRSTNFESINSDILEYYFKTLKQEVMNGGLQQLEYINGDTPLFERTGNIDLVFNRAVLYRSNMLHSGNLSEAIGLPSNPTEGRLTANLFINFEKHDH